MKYIIFIFLGLITISLHSQSTIKLIDSLDFVGETRTAIKHSLILLESQPNSKVMNYNISCRYAKVNEIDSSFKYLNKVIKLGYKRLSILADNDLTPLHKYDKWNEIEDVIINNFKQKNTEITNLDLAIQLMLVGYKDQNIRTAIFMYEGSFLKNNQSLKKRLWKEQSLTDSINTLTVLNVIKQNNGFPSEKQVGKKANRYTFLILQHANPITRKKNKKIIITAYKDKRLEAKYYGMYLDRLLLDKGKKQKYGTQFIKNELGEFILSPANDIKKINKNRLKIGMEKLI